MHIRFASLLALLSAGLALAAPVENGGGIFDYFVFVRQWSGSFCQQANSCPLVHRDGYHFTIHGLWPEYNDGQWPQFCKKDQPFDEDKLKDLMDQLEEEWPSFMKENDGFWSHEWLKHGTCAEDIMPDEHTYFATILRLHVEFDLADILKAKDIVPSKRESYATADIIEAIKAHTGRDPKVHCNNDGALTEVWMCMGKDLRPIDCPTHETPRCDHVKIPLLGGDGDEGDDEPGMNTAAVDTEVPEETQFGWSSVHHPPMAPGVFVALFFAAFVVVVGVFSSFGKRQAEAARMDGQGRVDGFSQGLLHEREGQIDTML